MQNNLTNGKAFKAAIGLWLAAVVANMLGLGSLHELGIIGAKVCLLAAVVLTVFPMVTGGENNQGPQNGA